MECERFKKLLKSWYIQVQNEALAPARMVDFMENHVADCPVCLMDPEAKKDIAKIITLVLPQEKLRQTIRTPTTEGQDDLGYDGDEAGLGGEDDSLEAGDEEERGDAEDADEDMEDDFDDDLGEGEDGDEE